MPWSNQSGGGGRRGGNGPWGQPPRGGGGGPTPPDLEELLRRSQDKLRQVLPGGGGGSATSFLPLVLVAMVGFWLYQSVYVVQPDEVGIELRFGEAKSEINPPGMHFILWPIESVEKPKVLQENQETITGAANRGNDGGIMLSGDQNLVDVRFTVLWRIGDPVKYLFNVADQEGIVRKVSEAAMREYVGRTRADEFRTRGRELAQGTVSALIQSTLDSYDAGILITAVNIEQAAPPAEVGDAFQEVQRAQQDQAKFKQDAQAYANKRLGDARGEASQVREAALGYRDRVIAEAIGESQRFTSVYTEYANAPDVTRRRIYLETMENVLARSNKVVIDSNGANGVVPYLPLPALQQGQAQAAGQENR
ncbi:FtsH protease activity modulator HflK [Methylobrevis albus]|uniref:Protein HflK n=1 Tax=Methylobrevis albus TaxID=2793297 RepID=A0A931HY92_9HYPH|nr:FtsH protease activity modulator HflK [Methylobrevis albus]MBH0236717.1 FtsH protease activity modulator HflK [Methylobrevis albus]